jgi:hypothetical protein
VSSRHDAPAPDSSAGDADDIFAGLTAIDVIDGEFVPRRS